jgi:hypothetical protein
MKKELLEQIIRQCVKEVLEIVPVVGELHEADTVGAPAPPAGGQGIGQTIPIPDEEEPLVGATRGVFFVNPKNPTGKPEPQKVKNLPDAQLERELYKLASRVAGPRVRIAANTLRSIKNYLQNPNLLVFLYIGKQDPDSDELYLLADKTLQGARTNTAQIEQPTDYDVTALSQDVDTQDDIASRMATGGRTVAPQIDEEKSFRNMLTAMVREALLGKYK